MKTFFCLARYGGANEFNTMFYEAPLNFVPYVLEMSSCLHVTLLMFLRLMAIHFPLSYQTSNMKFRQASIVIIWIVSILAQIIPLAVLYTSSKQIYTNVRLIFVQCCGTVPVISIVIMNVLLLWSVKRRQRRKPVSEVPAISENSHSISESMSRRMTRLVQKLVAFLLLCYVPYLTWAHYFYAIMIQREDPEPSEIEVSLRN